MNDKVKKVFKWIWDSFIWLGVLLLIIDIVTKNIIVNYQDAIKNAGGRNGGVDLIPGFLGINYLINKNIAFGVSITGSDLANRLLFIFVALTITAVIIVIMVKKWDKINKYYRACLFMIISGAIGNCIDRIFYSASYLNYTDSATGQLITGVVDWIDFYGIWGFNFNIADCAVVIAAFMLIIYMIVLDIIDYVKKSKLEAKEESENTTKAISKTEQEKNKYLDNKDENDSNNG